MKVNKWNEDREHIEMRKQLCLIGVLIILFGLVLGYWTAYHTYADELSESGDTNTTGTNTGTTVTEEDIEMINDRLDELADEIDEKIQQLDEDTTLILNYLELQNAVSDLQSQVEELTNPEEQIEEPIEEDIILDTETQYQYFPYIMIIICMLGILVFRRKY